MSITSTNPGSLRRQRRPAPRVELLASVLPPGVVVEERFGSPAGGALFPEEERVVAAAVERRRLEYATVRACARACLERLGHPPVAILPGREGAPIWPAGTVGSMTHCDGYAAAAVAPADHLAGLGIDAEPDLPLPEGVLDLIATPAEQELLAGTARLEDGPCWERLLFSAKEAVYKAWCPTVSTWLDPHECEVAFQPNQGAFTVVVHRTSARVGRRPVSCLQGGWARRRGVLVTAVGLPRG
jgi:4'-phosphopantetheinyl transferase EntD